LERNPKCDLCSEYLSLGEVYVAYSDLVLKKQKTGLMLICDRCADDIFSFQTWNEANTFKIQHTKEIIKSGILSTMKQLIKAVGMMNKWSIALALKSRGISASEAKQEAKRLGRAMWRNERRAIQELQEMYGLTPSGMTTTPGLKTPSTTKTAKKSKKSTYYIDDKGNFYCGLFILILAVIGVAFDLIASAVSDNYTGGPITLYGIIFGVLSYCIISNAVETREI
jgi:hypothetical protein